MSGGCVYSGYSWPTLEAACHDLGLEAAEVRASGLSLAAYIRQHRFLYNGLVFSSIQGVAHHAGIPAAKLQQYLAHGFSLALAVHMIQQGLPIDYFALPLCGKASHKGKNNDRFFLPRTQD